MRPETLVSIKNIIKDYPQYFKGTIYDIGSNTKSYREHPSQNYNMEDYFLDVVYVDKQADPIMGDRHIVSDALNMHNIPSDSVDGITCCELLEHVVEPIRVLSECNRILKSYCGIIVSTLWLYPLHDPMNDFLRYTDRGLQLCMEKADFIVLRSFYETTEKEPDWAKNCENQSGGLENRIGVFALGVKK